MRRTGNSLSGDYGDYYNKAADKFEKASEATDRFINRFKRHK